MRTRAMIVPALVGGALACAAPAARGQTYTWTGAVNSQWDTTTTNWSGAGTRWVNSATSDAVLAVNGTITPQIAVQVNNLSRTGSTGTTLISGTLDFTFVGVGSGVDVAGDGVLRIDESVMGTVGLTKTGTGTLALGRWCGFSGPVTISGGALLLDWFLDNTIPTTTDVSIAFGASLRLNRSQEVAALTGSGTVASVNSGCTLSVGGSAAGSNFSGDMQDMASSLTIRKVGTGTQTLSGSSSLASGSRFVDAGTLISTNIDAMGSGPITVASGGTWGVQGGGSIWNVVTIAGAGAASRRGAIDNISGSNTLENSVNLSADATIGATAGTLTFTNSLGCGARTPTFNPASGATIRVPTVVQDAGVWTVVKNGAGELVLTAANGFSNGITINAGRVSMGDVNSLSNMPVTMPAAGASELNLNGFAPQIGSLNGGNASSLVTNSVGGVNSGRLLRLNVPSGTSTFAGVITDGASSQTRLEKRGAGEQVLSANQTYTGNTNVVEGTLTTSGSLNGASVDVSGGTLDGSGTINCPVSLNSGVLSGVRTLSQWLWVLGGTVKPGASGGAGLGAITLGAGITFTGGAIELRDPTTLAGTGDRLIVTGGAVVLGNGVATLTIQNVAVQSLSSTARVVLIANNGAGATTGSFAGLPNGSEVQAVSGLGGQDHWYIYYNADLASGALTGGNDVVLTPQAPATIFNGGFEQGTTLGVLQPFNHNIAYWEVSFRGSIDWTTSWQAAEGTHSVDLQGLNAAGGVRQMLNLPVGQRYRLTFGLAGNPDNAPAIKHMRVQYGNRSWDYQFDITGKSRTNMGWEERSLVLVGQAGNAYLEFYSTDPASSWGAVIDNVRLVATPCAADIAQLGGTPGANGSVTVDDLVYFLNRFFAGDGNVADIVAVGGAAGSDGQITVDDLIAYLSAFFSVCP